MAKLKAESSSIIASIFTIVGIALIYFSMIYSSEILALIGLGLLFWGATFFLITPSGFVDARLLLSTVYSEYSTFDRIIDNFESKKCYYIPLIDDQNVVYRDSKKTKDPIMLLSPESNLKTLEDETFFTQKKFFVKNNMGLVLTPPGLGLMKMIQKKKINFNNIRLEKVCEVVPHLMLAQDFPLAKDLTMNLQDKQINLIIQKSMFKGLYSLERGSNSAKLFGCPIVSSIGCILAQTSRKIITIDEIRASKDGSVLQAFYRIVN